MNRGENRDLGERERVKVEVGEFWKKYLEVLRKRGIQITVADEELGVLCSTFVASKVGRPQALFDANELRSEEIKNAELSERSYKMLSAFAKSLILRGRIKEALKVVELINDLDFVLAGNDIYKEQGLEGFYKFKHQDFDSLREKVWAIQLTEDAELNEDIKDLKGFF